MRMMMDREIPTLWLPAIGVMALMVAVGIAGYVTYRYFDDVDTDILVYDTWLNAKRGLFADMEDRSSPVDTNGDPKRDDHITRSEGGTLEWVTTLYEVEGSPLSSPALVDFNNNGNREIVIASAGDAVYCLEPNGGGYYWNNPFVDEVIDYLGETPQTEGLDFKPPPIFSSVIVADVTLGDTPEVIVGVKDGALCLNDRGDLLWKKGLTSGYYFSTACITDLDGDWTGDKEDLEIVLASDDENKHGWLEAFEVDGGAVFREECPTGWEGGLIGCSVVAHDLDGDFYDQYKLINPDPSKERDTELIIGNHDKGLRVFERQGENSEGKPNYDETTPAQIIGHQTYGTTAVANVTGTQEDECFIFASEGSSLEWKGWWGKVLAFTPQGRKLWEYTVSGTPSSVMSSGAIADVQVSKDDLEEEAIDYEMAFSCDSGDLYMMNLDDHSIMWTFDTGGRGLSSPAFCNIDNDDMLEVVVGSDSGKVFCLEGDPSDGIDEGIQYDGDGPLQDVLWVYQAESPIGISSPAIADIDLDGQLEAVIGDSQGHVYSISCGGGSMLGQADWPEFHYDLNRTGFYNPQTSYGIDLYAKRDPGTGMSDPLIKEVSPGDEVTYNITLENTGEGISVTNRDRVLVRIDPSSVPLGWSAWLDTPPAAGQDDPDFVRLASGEKADLVLHVTAPWEGRIGEFARINVTANSSFDRWASDRLPTMTLLDLYVDFDLQFLKAPETDPLSPFFGEKYDRIDPGARQQYLISVMNKGNINDTYAITLSPPPMDAGWDWCFIDTGSRNVTLDLGSPIFERHGAVSGATLLIEVACPGSALKDTRIPIELRGVSIKSQSSNVEAKVHTDTLTMWVGEFVEVSLRLDESTRYVDPNGTVEFTLYITNLGNKDIIKVRLRAEGSPGWVVRYPMDDLPVFQGQTDARTIRITAPGNARAGAKLVMNVEGVVVGSNSRDSEPLTVIVNHIHRFDASVLQKEGIASDPGSSAFFNVQISNLGNGEDVIAPTGYEVPLEWNVTFYDREGFQRYTVDLEYMSNVMLLGRIKVPDGTRAGTYTVGINMSGEGSHKVLYMLVRINQTYDLRVRTEEGMTDLAASIQPVQERPFMVAVSNLGNGVEPTTVRLGGMYDPVRDTNDPLPDGWEGRFVAISNTPDFTTNIRYADLAAPIRIGQVGADVYYIPDPDSNSSLSNLNTVYIVLDMGETAYVHFIIEAPSDAADLPGVTGVQVSATGEGIDDWDVAKYDLTVLYPDLAFSGRIELFGSDGPFSSGDVVTISVKVVNVGDISAENVDVQLLVDGQVKKVQTLRSVKNGPDDVKTVVFSWVAVPGTHEITVALDPFDTVKESADQYVHQGSQDNNVISRRIEVDGNGFMKLVLSENPVISTLLIILLGIAILVGAALYLKRKWLI